MAFLGLPEITLGSPSAARKASDALQQQTNLAGSMTTTYNDYMPQLLKALRDQASASSPYAQAQQDNLTAYKNNMMGDMQRTGEIGARGISTALARRGIAGTTGNGSTALTSGLADYYNRLQRSYGDQMLGVENQVYNVGQQDDDRRRQALLALLNAVNPLASQGASLYGSTGNAYGQIDSTANASVGNFLGTLLQFIGTR